MDKGCDLGIETHSQAILESISKLITLHGSEDSPMSGWLPKYYESAHDRLVASHPGMISNAN